MGEYKSGKDFFTDYLVEKEDAVRLSFSDEVRRLATEIFPWLPFHITPEQKDVPYIHSQNPNKLTPRQIWLTVGKVRDVDPYFFVNKFSKRHEYLWDEFHDDSRLYIITDFRTPNEWDFIQAEQIPVLKIELNDRTGMPPSDFEEFVRQFKYYDSLFINHKDGTEKFDEHFRKFREQIATQSRNYR